MNQESPRILIHKLKSDIRKAAQRADSEPKASMMELRELLEKVIRDTYRRSSPNFPDVGREDLYIEMKKTKMVARLKENGILSEEVAACAFTACNNLDDAAHYRAVPPTGSDFIRSLKNLLRVLKWYEREYWTAATDEAAGLSEQVDRVADKGDPYAGTIVILAGTEPESDIRDEWCGIQKYLTNYGVTVIPDRNSLVDESNLNNALFIQLFSPLDPLDRTRRLLEKFASEHGSNRVFQWRKTLPNPRIDSEIVKSLDEEDIRFCEGENVQTGSFEDFKQQVRNQLDQLNKRRERPYLYLTFDRSNKNDDNYATSLNDVAREIADVKLMSAKNPGGDFVRALRKATGFVFLYGDTDSSFIEEWMGRYTEGRRGKAHLTLAALYQAPPRNGEMRNVEPRIGLRTGEWRKYGSRVEFIVKDIEDYCRELRNATN